MTKTAVVRIWCNVDNDGKISLKWGIRSKGTSTILVQDSSTDPMLRSFLMLPSNCLKHIGRFAQAEIAIPYIYPVIGCQLLQLLKTIDPDMDVEYISEPTAIGCVSVKMLELANYLSISEEWCKILDKKPFRYDIAEVSYYDQITKFVCTSSDIVCPVYRDLEDVSEVISPYLQDYIMKVWSLLSSLNFERHKAGLYNLILKNPSIFKMTMAVIKNKMEKIQDSHTEFVQDGKAFIIEIGELIFKINSVKNHIDILHV
jgi:hypothetical protein